MLIRWKHNVWSFEHINKTNMTREIITSQNCKSNGYMKSIQNFLYIFLVNQRALVIKPSTKDIS